MEVNPSILFWSAVNFLILFFLLRKFFWGPILETMSNREKEIADNIAAAENAREEAARLKASYEERLAEARREAQRIVEEARQRAEVRREELIQKAQEEAREYLQRAEETIRRERDAAIAALRQEVADIAIMTAGKILDRELSREDNRRLAARFVEEVGKLR